MVRDQLPVLTEAEVLYVVLYDSETQQFSFPVAVHTVAGTVKMGAHSLGHDEFSFIINRNAPLLLAGTNMTDARLSYGVTEPLLPEARCFLGVPMASGDQVVGVLAVQDNQNPYAFGFNDQRILTTVANQLGVAIYKARLFAQTQRFAEELEERVVERTEELNEERQRIETLYEITAEVAASLDSTRVLSGALEKVASAIGATSAVILGIDEISDKLFVLYAWGGLPVQDEDERTHHHPDRRAGRVDHR
ncbi:MAG: GAF domain-containing protein [Anaerolineae bacterium]|nr:GAF domain-containing protein [Anaerolineae bacterium]